MQQKNVYLKSLAADEQIGETLCGFLVLESRCHGFSVLESQFRGTSSFCRVLILMPLISQRHQDFPPQ